MTWLTVDRHSYLTRPAPGPETTAISSNKNLRYELMPPTKKAASFFAPLQNFFRRLFWRSENLSMQRQQGFEPSSIKETNKTSPAIEAHGVEYKDPTPRHPATEDKAVRPMAYCRGLPGDSDMTFEVAYVSPEDAAKSNMLNPKAIRQKFEKFTDSV